MKNWLFFPQEYVQMIFILLTQWKIHRALCLLSYLLPLVCIITVFPRKRNGLLCLGSQIISYCRQRSWCRSKLGSLAFPFKCLISLFYLLSINSMWTGSGVPKWVRGRTGVGGTSVWWMGADHLRTRGRCEQPHRPRHAWLCPREGLIVRGANDSNLLSLCSSLVRGLQAAA